jgi:hypothetical protein
MLWASKPQSESKFERYFLWPKSSTMLFFNPDNPAQLVKFVEGQLWQYRNPAKEVPEAYRTDLLMDEKQAEIQRIMRAPGSMRYACVTLV